MFNMFNAELNQFVLRDRLAEAEKRQHEQPENLDTLSPNTAWSRLPFQRNRDDNHR